MKISKRLYVDEGVQYHKWKIWKLRKNKKIENLYCILYTEDKFLEIVKSKNIKGWYTDSVLIGLAETRQDAMELLARIFDEVYVPNPDIQEMKAYFTVDNS